MNLINKIITSNKHKSQEHQEWWFAKTFKIMVS